MSSSPRDGSRLKHMTVPRVFPLSAQFCYGQGASQRDFARLLSKKIAALLPILYFFSNFALNT
jgi:hypothetical protein